MLICTLHSKFGITFFQINWDPPVPQPKTKSRVLVILLAPPRDQVPDDEPDEEQEQTEHQQVEAAQLGQYPVRTPQLDVSELGLLHRLRSLAGGQTWELD